MSLKIVLASSSASRQALLKRIINEFTCISPDIDETPKPDETAYDIAERLSYQKALAVATESDNSLIIAGDQTAECDGNILHKPLSVDNAKRQLRACSGKVVNFYSGLCTYNTQTQQHSITVETAGVHFRQLSDEEINRYVNKEPAINSVGAFKCEGLGISLFSNITGGDSTTLMGLPLIPLTQMLIKEDLNPLFL